MRTTRQMEHVLVLNKPLRSLNAAIPIHQSREFNWITVVNEMQQLKGFLVHLF